ncbi:DUF5057 domain-containing protein [Histomonas meleagridis]|uniref:DUF5057 domain-containing protein n=1 Tax=Histomonas meleagridis TaxID=135588 RepID=UPI00355A4B59|nr:DUF5057 domain-containing protein [Histomonas meleagridis]KAH0797268.1 DUF5057 domain-containing protein [Histomonas meleagridis]
MLSLLLVQGIANNAVKIDLEVTVNASYASGKGGTYLSWSSITGQDIYYKVFQKTKNTNGEWDASWKQISTYKAGTRVDVLNIYPSQIDGNNGQRSKYNNLNYQTKVVEFKFAGEDDNKPWHRLSKSAALKVWMEGGKIREGTKVTNFTAFGIDQIGKQLIFVTPISINDFESNITANSSFIYDYQVIVFGTWDASSHYGIKTTTAEKHIKPYIDKGYGFLAGHDSIAHDFYVGNQATSLLKIRDSFGIKSLYTDQTYEGKSMTYNFIQKDKVTIVRKGLLTNYPYEIGDVGTVLSIPTTHTNSHATLGDVWMTLGDTNNDFNPTKKDTNGLQHNFYLSTKNNTAVIQTGHSNCDSTVDERKVIANTIYYLNQRTYETFTEDHSSQDYEAPKVRLNYLPDAYGVDILGEDHGSSYKFKVEAHERSNDKLYAESPVVETEVTTGIDHYKYIITSKPEVRLSELVNTTKDNFIPLTSEQITNGMRVYVAAVDGAGNVGTMQKVLIPIPDPTPSQSPSPSRSPSESISASRSISASASPSKSISASQSPSASFINGIPPQDEGQGRGNGEENSNLKYYIIAGSAAGVAAIVAAAVAIFKKFGSSAGASAIGEALNGSIEKDATIIYENPLYNATKDDPFDDDFEDN